MTFEWDERKNAANIAKHGVSLETASLIFKGAIVTRIDGRTDYGELREVSIGKVGAAFLTVVHTDREGSTRIISARPANRAERKRYEEAL
jgi:uncharacterized DUF497 family protein